MANAEDQQRGDERHPAKGVVVQLELIRAVEAHPGKREMQSHIEQRKPQGLGHEQTSVERSGSRDRPAEVDLGKPAGCEDLADGLNEGGDDGELDQGLG